MMKNGLPRKQGLYDPQFEHDACGIGYVVNIKGRKSHDIVRQALTILANLEHRGAVGSEANTGDGAGILIQLPHLFFVDACAQKGIQLPDAGQYGVGQLFMSPDKTMREKCQDIIAGIIREEGQTLLGWREMPVNDTTLGETAKACMPCMTQVFIGRSAEIKDDAAFERKLFIIRKRAENAIRYTQLCSFFYAASFSCRTIVYKGMLTSVQVDEFFLDLSDTRVQSAIALVHSRYSTNTFPSWERAHPNRYLIHNGEINTLRGNVNWMNARQSVIESDAFGDDLAKVLPLVNQDGSDSAMFDNTMEFITLSGRHITHAAMMMIPEPWQNHETMSDEKRAFYEYHATLMEPWDGPAAMAFTDGVRVGAALDRNGLRPSRYYILDDDTIIAGSEVGVLDIDPARIVKKDRLRPGRMFLVDTEEGRLIEDEELKDMFAKELPYREWLDKHLLELKDIPESVEVPVPEHETVLQRQKTFGYTYEELRMVLAPMARDGVESLGAMGIDSPIAVLSDRPQLLFNYFKQLFAQVTNPPIDCLREEIITATETYMGSEGNLVKPVPESARQIKLKTPVLDNAELAKLKNISVAGFKSVTLPTLFNADAYGAGIETALEKLFADADKAIADGCNILILSDRGLDKNNAPIPSLLALSGLHHHLIKNGTRTRVSLIVESGEPREVHHFAVLIGYGASAVNPYLAFETLEDMITSGILPDMKHAYAVEKYRKAITKGVVKILSKMGISTIQSYQGAQIFEAIGISAPVIDKYFTNTPSRIEGIDLDIIAKEVQIRHQRAFQDSYIDDSLEPGGELQFRADGEVHMYNPETIHKLQFACRSGNYELFKEYTRLLNEQNQNLYTLRGMFRFKNTAPVSIDEVESVDSIVKRFKTGAMSYGSISQEAHEAMAVAMNRLGGKSNTGEGGEDPSRFAPMANGDSKCSAIKQVASGRFGVTSHYLVNAQEIQIKMAQGAKPGEGGQLPGKKVYPWVARTRHSTPGVGLISPPPHHDIYSIEDLAELIHDLKNANRNARISVKLVSEVGVGTVAAGVAKGRADVILISGYDGGTGASPRTSIKHAGLPWELGLAETHQTLMLNNLRSRVIVETDGKLMTGRDVAIAALLGAEEFGFATAPLVVLGCVMMRVCNLDTCPVGVATQNPALRAKFAGQPEHLENFMRYIAQELREYMAQLGFRSLNEMIGRADLLDVNDALDHWKAKGLDFSSVFYQPEIPSEWGRFCQTKQDHGIEKTLDATKLLKLCAPALESGEAVSVHLPIRNTNRVAGTVLGSEITKKYGAQGLPDDTVRIKFSGSAGQSLAAFVPKGVTIELEGDANDYVGKGLSGGKIIIYPPKVSTFKACENILIGNVALYGATGGEAYIAGMGGERFCVRNSGVKTVIEGVGDHGCEYMTGGRVVVLGPTGRNFGAGMSGGIAYILDEAGDFLPKLNREMTDNYALTDAAEIAEVRTMIEKHAAYTGSAKAEEVLANFDAFLPKFVKVLPRDFKRMMEKIAEAEASGLTGEEALMAAFNANNSDTARIGGN